MKEVGKRQLLLVFVPFINKSKAFPAATYLFPLMPNCPELRTWLHLATRKVRKLTLQWKQGRRVLGMATGVSQLIQSTIGANNNL